MKVKNSGNFALITSMIAVASLSRLIPHAPNFTALGAMALFAGAMWGVSLWSVLVPWISLALTDLVFGEHPTMIYVYGSVLAITLLGAISLKKKSAFRLLGVSLLSSLIFFFVTNFGVWASAGLYSPGASGLMESLVMGLPFLKNQVAGDLFYSVAIFAAYEACAKVLAKLSPVSDDSSI